MPPPNPAPRDIASETRRILKELAGLTFAALVGGVYVGALTQTALLAPIAFTGILLLSVPPVYRKLHAAEVWTINSSFNLIGLGKLSEASLLLDQAEARPLFAWVRRLVDIQRGIIAMRLGDLEEARARLDAAITRPLGIVARANSLYQIEGAYALRAFVLASLGEREGALSDIAYVRSRGNASPDALARVALAEALVLERAGDRARLKELIEREETLLLEHSHPRERAIVRALQRMLKTSSRGSIYRQASPREEAPPNAEEPALADWVAKIAPGAAPFVRAPRRPASGSPALIREASAVAPRLHAVRAVEASRAAGARKKKPIHWAWAGLPLAFIGLLVAVTALAPVVKQALPTKVPWPALGAGLTGLLQMLVLMGVLSISVFAAWKLISAKRARTKARRAAARSAAPRVAGAGAGRESAASDQHLEALTKSPSNVAAAQAHLRLASRAERRADFSSVLRHCDLGIGRLVDRKDRAEADILYPDLISLRAFALAASGRSDEADVELGSLGPVYPHHSRAVFRVRLVQMLRRQDRTGAARWVEQGAGDLPLSVREELLADIVRAMAAPAQAGAGEIERIKDELRRSPERRKWLDVVVHGIVAAFEQSGEVEDAAQPRVRVEVPEARGTGLRAEGPPLDAVETEARAEEEAEHTSLERLRRVER